MHSFLEPKLLWFQGPGKKVIGRKRQDSGLTLRMNSFYFSHCCLKTALQAELEQTVSLTPDLSSSALLCPRGLLLIFCRPYLMPAFLKSHAICGSGFVLEKGTTDSLEPNKKDLFIQVNLNSSRETALGILGLFPQTKGSQGCKESSNLILSRV